MTIFISQNILVLFSYFIKNIYFFMAHFSYWTRGSSSWRLHDHTQRHHIQ